jgi:hypothetical protein
VALALAQPNLDSTPIYVTKSDSNGTKGGGSITDVASSTSDHKHDRSTYITSATPADAASADAAADGAMSLSLPSGACLPLQQQSSTSTVEGQQAQREAMQPPLLLSSAAQEQDIPEGSSDSNRDPGPGPEQLAQHNLAEPFAAGVSSSTGTGSSTSATPLPVLQHIPGLQLTGILG